MKSRYSEIQKITLSAFLMVLATLATIFAKLSGIPFLRFVQVSFAPAVIMFGSLALGPLYGAIIGGGSDLLGALLYPTGVFNPFYTVMAILWGILPWCLLFLTKRWRRAMRFPIAIYVVLLLLLGALAFGFYGTDYFDSRLGDTAVWAKPLILSIIAALDIGISIGLYFTNRYFQKSILDYPDIPSPNEVSLIATVCEIALGIFANAGALYFYFHVLAGRPSTLSYFTIALCLVVTTSVNILVNSFLLSWLLIFARRFGNARGNQGDDKHGQ